MSEDTDEITTEEVEANLILVSDPDTLVVRRTLPALEEYETWTCVYWVSPAHYHIASATAHPPRTWIHVGRKPNTPLMQMRYGGREPYWIQMGAMVEYQRDDTEHLRRLQGLLCRHASEPLV